MANGSYIKAKQLLLMAVLTNLKMVNIILESAVQLSSM